MNFKEFLFKRSAKLIIDQLLVGTIVDNEGYSEIETDWRELLLPGRSITIESGISLVVVPKTTELNIADNAAVRGAEIKELMTYRLHQFNFQDDK